jgi:hypothetical protein
VAKSDVHNLSERFVQYGDAVLLSAKLAESNPPTTAPNAICA